MTDVVITGVGVITPIGNGVDAFWDGLMEGRSGAGRITRFDASELPVQIACECSDFDATEHMAHKETKRTDLFAQMGIAAAALAVEDAGEEAVTADPERTGVIIGSGIGGLSTIEEEHKKFLDGGPRRTSVFMIPKLMGNAAAGGAAMRFGLLGPNFAPVSACATSGHALGEALRLMQHGDADVMLAGGTEAALTPLAVSAFARMGALSSRNDDPEHASRPFDADRDGFVFGEGAGVMVLERREAAEKRGADIIAELAGYGASADAYHITQPDPKGKGAGLAMLRALEDAGSGPEEVDYINAHGTSTPFNDRAETAAIKNTFGNEAKRIPVSSTKSQIGHLIGAAGAVEAAVAALAIHHGVIPGTINLDKSDPDCDLDYVSTGPREAKVELALSNSFGFGGHNACIALRRP